MGANLVASLHMSKIEKVINTDDKVQDMITYDKDSRMFKCQVKGVLSVDG